MGGGIADFFCVFARTGDAGGGAKGKYTAEELAVISLEEVKKMIIAQEPKAFDKKAPAKKKAAKK